MTRLRQVLIIALGLLAAAVMVWLGIWQLDVYRAQGEAAAARRAAEPPVALTSVAPAGAAVRDGYGRSVQFDGVYLGRTSCCYRSTDRSNAHRVLRPCARPMAASSRSFGPDGIEMRATLRLVLSARRAYSCRRSSPPAGLPPS